MCSGNGRAYFEISGVDGGRGGKALVTVNYSNGATGNGNATVTINGAESYFENILNPVAGASSVVFPPTGNWESPWNGKAEFIVKLQPGFDNTVRVVGGNGGFNAHSITISFIPFDAPDTVNGLTDIKTFALKVNDGGGGYSYVTEDLQNRTNDINDAAVFERDGDSSFKLFGTAAGYIGGNPLQISNGGTPGNYAAEELNDKTVVLREAGGQYIYSGGGGLSASGADSGVLLNRVEIEVIEYTNPVNPSGDIILSAASITFEKHEMDAGATKTVRALGFTNPEASNRFLEKIVKWESDDDSVAAVDANGVITAHKGGEARITASLGGAAAECVVLVNGDAVLVTNITVLPATLSLAERLTRRLGVTISPSNASLKDVEWTSSDENIATVDQNGVVRGVSEGSTTIRAAAQDGSDVFGECAVTITARPPVVDFGDIKKFALKVNNDDGSYRYVSLNGQNLTANGGNSIDGDNVAIFDVRSGGGNYGFVLLGGDGYACQEENNIVLDRGGIGDWETFDIDVTDDGALALIARRSLAAATPYVYANNNSVNASLRATGANTDNALNRVEIEALEYAEPAVPATGIILNTNAETVTVYEEKIQLTATGYTPADASNKFLPKLVTWTSSDENIAAVDRNGLVTVIGNGSVTITAAAGGTAGICEITADIPAVPPTGVTVSPANRNLTLGFTAQLTASVQPENSTSKKITWSTSDAGVVSVDADTGVITAAAVGAATITATTTNGLTGICEITVTIPSDGKPNIYTGSAVGSDDVIVYVKNVLDFGASGDGVSDNTAAFQAAIYAARDAGGGVVFAPAGIYAFRGNLHVPTGVTLRGEWLSPLEGGGKGEGTVLAVYGGRGDNNLYDIISTAGATNTYSPVTGRSFIGLDSSGTVRDLSFWWPEQKIDNVTPYPFAVGDDTRGYTGSGGNDVINVMNVTMYNAYNGVMSYGTHGCTTVRNMFGTVLNVGISEDAGYDIGRMENIYFDSKYWAESTLEGAPGQSAVSAYTRENAIGIAMWQDDWGYMFNLNFNHMNIGLQMNDGNCAASHITAANVNYGVYIRSISYPGFKLANSAIDASIAGLFYDVAAYTGVGRNKTDGGVKTNNTMGGREQVAVSNVTFGGNPDNAVVMNLNRRLTNPALSLQNCTFVNWKDYAVNADRGAVIIMDNEFRQTGKAIKLTSDITAANILGNRFNNYTADTIESAVPVSRMNLVNDFAIEYPPMPEYEYEFAPIYKPANENLFINVKDAPYNAAGNGLSAGRTDDTAAIQAALDAAGDAGGGTVFMPGGTYWVKGGLTVPSGVQLRGTYDAPHTGKVANTAANSVGSVIVVYGDSATEANKDTATINLSADAALRGITFFYPEQRVLNAAGQTPSGGYGDDLYGAMTITSKLYPWVVRGLGGRVSITNIAMVNPYNGIDLMYAKSDGSVVADINGYALGQQMQMGADTVGGWVQDVHFNQCNWQQSNWPNNPGDYLDGYAGANIQAFKYGAMKDVYNFQNFTITVDKAVWLVEEPQYGSGETGGLFSGTFNGFAFDSNQTGLHIENSGDVYFINAMCVTNLPPNGSAMEQKGGPNIKTLDTFEGTVYYYNGDSWGSPSQICDINGGTVYIVQYKAESVPQAVVNGGRLYMYAALFGGRGNETDLVVNADADSVNFAGNIGHGAPIKIANNSINKLSAQYNLNVNGTLIPEYGDDILFIETGRDGGAAKVKLTNIRQNQAPVSGTVKMILPLEYEFAPVRFENIAYEDSIEITFPPISANKIMLEIECGGAVFTETIEIDAAYAEKATGAITENPAENNGLPALVMNTDHYIASNDNNATSWGGPDDLSAESYFAWDDDNLYMYVIVNDDIHWNDAEPGDIWQGDSLQFGVDMTNAAGGGRNELGVALGTDRTTIKRTDWGRVTGATASLDLMDVKITRDDASGTTVYDLAVPWIVVHPTLTAADVDKIGVSVFINDGESVNGAPAARRQEAEAKAGQLKDPSLFTRLYLLNGGGYDAMITAAAEEAVDKALESGSAADKDMASNLITVIKDDAAKAALTEKLDSQEPVIPETRAITASAGAGGRISPSGEVIVEHGANQTFTITANVHYYVSDVIVNGISQGAVRTYTFNNVTANQEISATFAYSPPYVPPTTQPETEAPQPTTEAPPPPETEQTVTNGGELVISGGAAGSDGIIYREIDETLLDKAIDGALEEGGRTIEISVEIPASMKTEDVKGFAITIPEKEVEKIAESDLELSAKTADFSIVSFDSKAMNTINETDTGDMTLTVKTVDENGLINLEASDLEKIGDRSVYSFAVVKGGTEVRGFKGGKATVRIPYKPSADESPNAIVVYYIDADGKLKTMRGHYIAESEIVEFITAHFSAYAVGYNPVEFSDGEDIAEVYVNAAEFMGARGTMDGLLSGGSAFDGSLNITRGEFIVMTMRALGIELLSKDEFDEDFENFADAEGEWEDYLAAAKQLGISKGMGNNLCQPDEKLTRQQMFVLIYRTLDILGELRDINKEAKTFEEYADYEQVADWAADEVKALCESETIIGDGVSIMPENPCERQQMALVLYRILTGAKH